MLNKKGFTLVELLAVIAIIGILSGVAIMAVSKYQIKATNDVYKNFEKQLKDSTINYLTSNIDQIPDQGTTSKIYAKTLKENNYLDDLVDPITESKMCINDNTANDSYVIVKNNSNISDGDTENITYDENGNMIINSSNIKNLDLEYTVCLMCSQYQSSACSS